MPKTLTNYQVNQKSLTGVSGTRRLVDNESSITNETNARILADSQLQTEIHGLDDRIGVVEEELEAVINLAPSSAVVTDASGDIYSSVTSDAEIAHLSGVSSNVQTQLDGKLSLTGGILTGDLSITGFTANRVLISDANKNLTSSSVSNTTLGYLDATSSVQTQLNGKLSISGGTVTGNLSVNGLTANRVLISDASKNFTSSSVSNTTLGYLDATSSVQTQLSSKLATAGGTLTGNLVLNNLGGGKVLILDENRTINTAIMPTSTLDAIE